MVRKTHDGRPGYRVIPDDYGERHATAANRGHTATCEIRAPETRGVFNATTGTYAITPGVLRYSGSCRVQQDLRDQLAPVTEQSLPIMRYLVSIDHSANTVKVHDRVTITDGEDAQLVGQVLVVRAVELGSMRAVRNLLCDDDLSV